MIKKISSTYEELAAVHEELTASEEELRAQYEELQCKEEALAISEERYRLALSLFDDFFEIDNRQVYVTASIGVASYPKDGTDTSTIMKNADSAMYKAKELGKNRFARFDEEIYLKLERKTHIDRILRGAIENNELSIHYQPQYEACRQSVKWLHAGYKFKSISINVSTVDMRQIDFLETVKDILKTTGVNPNIVELEITETVLMESLESNVKILKELRDMGIRIALDDFGTGYSSLNYLMNIPISTLKIDKSFIDNITSNIQNKSIIKNIIQMAHSMNLKVVAEGVETEQQLSILKEKKCDFIQGYYFSKPLSVKDTEKLLDSTTKENL